MNQLELEADEPGYYSYWASGKDCGTGAVGWFASAADATRHAEASFNRAMGQYRPEQRPRMLRATARLLIAGPDRGLWRDLSQEDRNTFTAHHPWMTGEQHAS